MNYHKYANAIGPAFVAGLLLASQPIGVALGQAPSSDTGSKSGAAVDISADQMELLEEQKKAIFTGNVDAKRGKVKLRSDKLVVDYVEVASKNGTDKTEIRFLNATGNVTIISDDQTIKSQRARMNVKDNTAVISGNVVVIQGKTRLSGNKFLLNLTTGQSHMEGGRVKAKFLPQQ